MPSGQWQKQLPNQQQILGQPPSKSEKHSLSIFDGPVPDKAAKPRGPAAASTEEQAGDQGLAEQEGAHHSHTNDSSPGTLRKQLRNKSKAQYHSQGKSHSLGHQPLPHGVIGLPPEDQKMSAGDAFQHAPPNLEGYELFNNFAYKNIPNQNPDKPFGAGANQPDKHHRELQRLQDQQASDKHLARKNFALKKADPFDD